MRARCTPSYSQHTGSRLGAGWERGGNRLSCMGLPEGMCRVEGITLLNRSVLPGLSVRSDIRGTSYAHCHIVVEFWETGHDRKINVF